MQPHLSACFLVGPCAAGDREHGIRSAVVEGTFQGQLACGKKDRSVLLTDLSMRGMTLLRYDLIKDVEGILHRHAPNMAEPGFRAQFAHFRLRYADGTQPFSMMC